MTALPCTAIPVAEPHEPVTHDNTLELLNALRDAGWKVAWHGTWEPAARLEHPDGGKPIWVTMDEANTTRLASVKIGDREVSFRRAIVYAQTRET